MQDLPGKVVGTWGLVDGPNYVQILQHYGVTAVAFPWDNPGDEIVMLDALQNRSLSGSPLRYLIKPLPSPRAPTKAGCRLSIMHLS